jgi:hypothetical protein
MEQWKPISLIPGFEEYVNYEMNTEGILRRTVACANAKAGHILTWRIKKDGYLDCAVSSNGKNKRLIQHRSIAYLFIDKPHGYDFIDHINGQRNDNRIENLRWCNVSENRRNSVKHKSKNGHKHISKICIHERYWYWLIDIRVLGKPIRRRFDCDPDDTEPPAEVIACRNKMVKELHGEFAVQS